MMQEYWVYIVEASDGTYYTGITTDIRRRMFEHNNTARGPKYTRSRRPVGLCYHRLYSGKSAALKEEARIKNLTRKQKIYLIESNEGMGR